MKKEIEMKRIGNHMRKRFLPKAAAVIILLTPLRQQDFFAIEDFYAIWMKMAKQRTDMEHL